jgi:hypothetical protein
MLILQFAQPIVACPFVHVFTHRNGILTPHVSDNRWPVCVGNAADGGVD